MIITRQLPKFVAGALATLLPVESLPVANAQDLAKNSNTTIDQRRILEDFHAEEGGQHPPVIFADEESPVTPAPIVEVPEKFAKLIVNKVWDSTGQGVQAKELMDKVNLLNSQIEEIFKDTDRKSAFDKLKQVVGSTSLPECLQEFDNLGIDPKENIFIEKIWGLLKHYVSLRDPDMIIRVINKANQPGQKAMEIFSHFTAIVDQFGVSGDQRLRLRYIDSDLAPKASRCGE